MVDVGAIELLLVAFGHSAVWGWVLALGFYYTYIYIYIFCDTV